MWNTQNDQLNSRRSWGKWGHSSRDVVNFTSENLDLSSFKSTWHNWVQCLTLIIETFGSSVGMERKHRTLKFWGVHSQSLNASQWTEGVVNVFCHRRARRNIQKLKLRASLSCACLLKKYYKKCRYVSNVGICWWLQKHSSFRSITCSLICCRSGDILNIRDMLEWWKEPMVAISNVTKRGISHIVTGVSSVLVRWKIHSWRYSSFWSCASELKPRLVEPRRCTNRFLRCFHS
jgi:hypothetical protein